MRKRIAAAIALGLGEMSGAYADYSSNGIIVTATPDTAVAATQTLALECAANQPVAKLIWHVDQLGWSGGDNVTSLRFPAKEVLAFLGGGSIQHVTARCSALDANGTEVANHDTTVTLYDPTHPDAFEPGSGAPAYFVPQVMTKLASRRKWTQSGAGASIIGIIDPVPLAPDEAWRRPPHVTAAILKGDVRTPKPTGHLFDPNGQYFMDYCRSALQPEPFPCPSAFVINGTIPPGGISLFGTQGIDYAGHYTVGFKVSRSLPMPKGYTTTDVRIKYSPYPVQLDDAAIGESYLVAPSEWGLYDMEFASPHYTRPEDRQFAGSWVLKDNSTLHPYLFFTGTSIGQNYENQQPATEFPANQEITMPLTDVIKRLVWSDTTAEALRNNYRILSIYQEQGDTTVDVWTSGVGADQLFHIKALHPGRAVLNIGVHSSIETHLLFLVTFVFV